MATKRRTFILLLALLFLVRGHYAVGQDKGGPAEGGPSAEAAKDKASLKLDLLTQQRATIQAKSDWIRSEQNLLSLMMDIWDSAAKNLQSEMNSLYGCFYDMDARKCAPETGKESKGSEKSKDGPSP